MMVLTVDSVSFARFLKAKLIEKTEDYNKILYSVSYRDMQEVSRLSIIITTLASIADSIDDVLKEFHKRSD
jgi:hypothetical protein